MAFCLALSIAALFSTASAQPADIATAFESANKLYAQGKFNDAAAAYEQLIESGAASAAVYYNLGNAFFKSGQIGRAIVVYRQAEQLSPHDPELNANLNFARGQVQGPTFKPSLWERFLNKLSVNEWTWLSVAALWLTFLLLAAKQLWPRSKRSFRAWALVCGAAAILLSGCLGCALAHRSSVRIAVVTADDAMAHASPFDESPGAFTAHDGAELRVLDQKDDWFQVSDGNRRIGWIKRANVVMTNQT